MKRPLLIALAILAACDAETNAPTAPVLAGAVRPDISGSTETGLFGGPLFGTVSPATVTSCQGAGLITSINVQYGVCTTDLNGGTGSIAFSGGGLTVALSARSGLGAPEMVASEWQSNGAVIVTSEICIAISVTHLSLQGGGEVQEQLHLSYNGAPQAPLTWLVTTTGRKTYCGPVPAGATNVWWQLITIVGVPMPAPTTDKGHRYLGGARVTQSLLEAPIAP